jgi:phage shock protein A
MANVHFWGRLGNLWKGFVGLWLEDLEKNQPELAYENAVQSMSDKYAALKRATAAILARREEFEARLSDEQKELTQIAQSLNAAIDSAQDDLGVILVQKRKALEQSVAELNQRLLETKGDADEAKSSLMSVKAEIEKLKAEKDRTLAKFQSAQACLKIQGQLEGLSVDADVKALENVRAHIKNIQAEAKLNPELHQDDLDTKLKALRQSSGTATARSELEALKAARAAQATQVKRSM